MKTGEASTSPVSESVKPRNTELGATLVESGMLIVLVALLALPATSYLGSYTRKPFCAPSAILSEYGTPYGIQAIEADQVYVHEGKMIAGEMHHCRAHPSNFAPPTYWLW